MTCPAPKANSVFIDFNSVGVMEIPSLDTGKEERPEGRKEGGRGGERRMDGGEENEHFVIKHRK